MKRIKKYIAYFLFGAFFFPVAFQSLHVVWHHSHGYCDTHLHCHSKHDAVHPQLPGTTLTQEEKICPICEYQFTVNDLPKTQIYKSFVPFSSFNFNESANHQQYNFHCSHKSPRAPPIHS